MSKPTTIRAIYRSCQVDGAPPPHNNIALKIYYRAAPDGGEEETNAGLVAADRSQGPGAVVIIMPGINVGPECYGWLASQVAEAGMVAVTYSWIAEEMPGYISLTPGIDLNALRPERYGQVPSAHGLEAIIESLTQVNAQGVLAGCLDLEHIVLAGHSAGGTLAMLNANPDWFQGVKGAFSYGAHAAAATALGYPPQTTLKLPSRLPLLLCGGTQDGVISASAHRYDSNSSDPLAPLKQTFEQGLNGDRGDCHFIAIDGANHFSMASPLDPTTGRPYLDWPTTQSDDQIRQLLGLLLTTFVAQLSLAAPAGFGHLVDHPLVRSVQTR